MAARSGAADAFRGLCRAARREHGRLMVIERFKPGAAPLIYRRLREQGRRLVDGLEYVSSWVDLDFDTCWQIMKTDDRALLEAWCEAGQDLVDCEIVPVRTSAEAALVMASR